MSGTEFTTKAPPAVPEGFTLVGTGDQFKNVGAGFLMVLNSSTLAKDYDDEWHEEMLEKGSVGHLDCWYAVRCEDMVDVQLLTEPASTEAPTPCPAGIDAPACTDSSDIMRVTLNVLGSDHASGDIRLIQLLEQVMAIEDWTAGERMRATAFLDSKYGYRSGG